MGNPDLLGSDDDENGEGDPKIVINKRFAKDFQQRKQREELRNNPLLNDDDDASASSDEDEDGTLLTTKLDTDIFKTINALRFKDKRIYDPDVRFFRSDDEQDSDESDNDDREQKRKPKRYKDVVREQALEQIEKEEQGIHDGAEEDNDGLVESEKSRRLAYDKEQEDIRKSFLQSVKGLDDHGNGSSDDGGDQEENLLVVKKKDPKEVEREEKEFAMEIQRAESALRKGDKDVVDPRGEIDNGSQFLLHYFKNRAWIDRDDDADSSDEDEPAFQGKLSNAGPSTDADGVVAMKSGDRQNGNESDTSIDQLDKTDDFEAQYNFRFEEAAGGQSGADFSLVSYARGQTVDTLRRKDDKRREKRLARKEKKAAERKAKEEELKRLKKLKRKEMERKLKQVKQVVGLADEDAELDEAAILKLIEGDYNPEDFEKKMQETFGDEFYSKEDSEWKTDKDVRDTLLKDEDGNLIVGQDNEGDMYDTIGDDAEDEEEAEGGEEYGDEEWDDEDQYDGDEEHATEDETELEKKVKSKMEEELYKLDYEDIVAGTPTRFKYRQVQPNDYGLTTEEILFARDTALKQFVSLKKMAPYRDNGEHAVGGRRRRRFRDMLKHEIEEELTADQSGKEPGDETNVPTPEEPESGKKKRKRRRSKKGTSEDEVSSENVKEIVDEDAKPVTNGEVSETVAETDGDADKESTEPKRKRKRRQKKKKASSETIEDAANLDAPNDANATGAPEKASRELGSVRHEETKPAEPESETVTASGISKDIPKKAKKKEKKHKTEKKDERKRDRKKKKKSHIEGISKSRLSSYGL